jgi:hypothetical protein
VSALTETIAFAPRERRRKERAKERRRLLIKRYPARVAKRLALAHRIAADIEAGRYADQADVARHHGLSRARLSQLLSLLLLAPDIQEEVLALEFPVGREPIGERDLRGLVESLVWAEQRVGWAELRAG